MNPVDNILNHTLAKEVAAQAVEIARLKTEIARIEKEKAATVPVSREYATPLAEQHAKIMNAYQLQRWGLYQNGTPVLDVERSFAEYKANRNREQIGAAGRIALG